METYEQKLVALVDYLPTQEEVEAVQELLLETAKVDPVIANAMRIVEEGAATSTDLLSEGPWFYRLEMDLDDCRADGCSEEYIAALSTLRRYVYPPRVTKGGR